MNYFTCFHSTTMKKLTAMLLITAFSASYFTLPAKEFANVYATENEVVSEQENTTLPGITCQPENVTAKPGDKVTFTVKADGENLKYQWYYKKAGVKSWSVWKGHTTSSTSATANATWNGMQVYCQIKDSNGACVDSDPSVITIEQPLTILSHPQSITLKEGGKARFSVSAQGKGKLVYQWYYRKAGVKTWSPLKGHTKAVTTVIANSTWNMMEVYCKVSDESGNTVESESASISLEQPLTILTQPEDITLKPDTLAKFKVSARGSGKLSYQWYYRKANTEAWSVWRNHTTAVTTATANSTWNGMEVYCAVTDASGAAIQSKSAVIAIEQPLTILAHPQSVTIKDGDTADFSVSAVGTGKNSYQWYRKMTGEESWSVWEHQTSATVSAEAMKNSDGMQVYCSVTDQAGQTVNSKSASLTVIPAITITSQPAYVTVRSGETASFTVSAEGSQLKYQWYYKKAGMNDWTLWSDKTSASISATADCTWHAMQVFCRVTDAAGQTADSDIAFAMITKKGNTPYIKRTFTVKSNKTSVYSAPDKKSKALGKLNAGASFSALEWGTDSSGSTWYRFNWKGKIAWIPRSKTTASDEFVTIPDRSFKHGGVPVIYLSPSRQIHNAYAAGSTTEQIQMYRVGEALKKILEQEYLCVVYMPPVSMTINLDGRPLDAYNKEADVYLAIHSNARITTPTYGATGYYFPACAQSKKLGENMVEEMGKISPFQSTVESKTVNGMEAFNNVGYAEVRDPAYYGMISLLAEVEYHDNEDSALWIIDNTDKIARALTNALERTIDMQKK